MRRLAFAAAVLTMLTTAPAALAEASRTWVSGVGDDANPCSRTAPCKTWAGAISKTAPGGEIDALDPGGFGAVTITKSITLNGRGTHASVLAAGVNGIVVSAGASDVVRLEHLEINGAGTGIHGISFIAGKALRIRDVEAFGFTPTNSSGLAISAANSATSVDNSYFDDNFFGIVNIGTSARLTVRNSSIDGNKSIGIVTNGSNAETALYDDGVTGPSNGTAVGIEAQVNARTSVNRCVVSANHIGIHDDGGGTGNSLIIVANTEITENDIGVAATSAGQILSQQNNLLLVNGTNGAFTGVFGPS